MGNICRFSADESFLMNLITRISSIFVKLPQKKSLRCNGGFQKRIVQSVLKVVEISLC